MANANATSMLCALRQLREAWNGAAGALLAALPAATPAPTAFEWGLFCLPKAKAAAEPRGASAGPKLSPQPPGLSGTAALPGRDTAPQLCLLPFPSLLPAQEPPDTFQPPQQPPLLSADRHRAAAAAATRDGKLRQAHPGSAGARSCHVPPFLLATLPRSIPTSAVVLAAAAGAQPSPGAAPAPPPPFKWAG